ncbi:hypothetical protein PBY51_007001 [Eleginops maclovinus]|uniref:Ankyrin repeat domain-containing protein 63 n=1 Tax=Eleginops maclovinus TaxID=56733 RepID=A0AAN7X287_ELEMC|nr:hypothetical protein PBY51_007001 [Eleginops maclovinus]
MLKAQGKSNGQTGTKILLDAMSKDKVHLARFVLDALDGEIVDSKTEDSQTPLISSILLPDGHTRCKFVELLLQKGASVNCQDGTGRTALSYGCEQGSLDAVKILVRHNADPEIVDVWGNTALMYASVAGNSHVVEFLVRSFKRLGLQIDRQNKVGNSAVEVAKFLGHTECVLALTNSLKKNREAQGNAQPQLSLGSVDVNDTFGRRVGHLVNKLEDFQTCDHADCLLVQNCSWPTRPRVKQNRLPSMDSIEEFEREQDGSSSPPQLVFSEILTPKPPPRTSDHHTNFKHPQSGDDLLPIPKQSCEAQTSYFPSGNIQRPSAPSALGILMSPILSNKSETDSVTEKSKTLDFVVRRFHESYYEKRFSLPTSILRPTPPDRTLVPVRKSRTVRRREASPCRADPPPFTAPTSTTSNTTFSVLSNKLLRRLTSPEIKKNAKELEVSPMLASGRIPRSETFPQCRRHPQVDSKPSIDSISSVKCEFGILK